MPTARAMPISDLRSAASITKIMKISSTPAPMENRPKARKNVVKMLPDSSARSTLSLLDVGDGQRSRRSRRAQRAYRSRLRRRCAVHEPPRASPLFETATIVSLSGCVEEGLRHCSAAPRRLRGAVEMPTGAGQALVLDDRLDVEVLLRVLPVNSVIAVAGLRRSRSSAALWLR